jgi:hypothetical protein
MELATNPIKTKVFWLFQKNDNTTPTVGVTLPSFPVLIPPEEINPAIIL